MYVAKRIIFLYLIISIVVCLSCKKNSATNDPPPTQLGHSPGPCVPTVTRITDPALLACKYLPGSYWVFKDSLSGIIDTLAVQKLERTTYLQSSYSCDTIENLDVKLSFKKETISAYKTLQFSISQYYHNVTFFNTHLWEPSSQVSVVLMYGPNSMMHDSLKLNSTFYKNVGETGAIQYVKDDPNRMEEQSMKIFFSPDFGPLQFDLRDRISGELKGRRQVLTRLILR